MEAGHEAGAEHRVGEAGDAAGQDAGLQELGDGGAPPGQVSQPRVLGAAQSRVHSSAVLRLALAVALELLHQRLEAVLLTPALGGIGGSGIPLGGQRRQARLGALDAVVVGGCRDAKVIQRHAPELDVQGRRHGLPCCLWQQGLHLPIQLPPRRVDLAARQRRRRGCVRARGQGLRGAQHGAVDRHRNLWLQAVRLHQLSQGGQQIRIRVCRLQRCLQELGVLAQHLAALVVEQANQLELPALHREHNVVPRLRHEQQQRQRHRVRAPQQRSLEPGDALGSHPRRQGAAERHRLRRQR